MIIDSWLDKDVNLNVPALFTLVYMHVKTLLGLTGYAGAVATSCREDQIKYFTNCGMIETMELYKRIADVMMHKVIFSKPPRINTPIQVDFVGHIWQVGWKETSIIRNGN